MEARLQEMEGTWEEIVARADELKGRKVRLIVLPGDASGQRQNTAPSLDVLLSGITEENRLGEWNTGPAVGNEAW